MKKRAGGRKAAAIVGAIAAALVVTLVVWGLIEPRLLDVTHEDVTVQGLPVAWEGERLAQVSDFQIGMWLDNPGAIEQAVDTILEEKPAAVLMSGDFVYHAADEDERVEQTRAVSRLIRPLSEADIDVYAVLGNHDYALKSKGGEPDLELARRVTQTLEEAGVSVLTNESVRLEAGGPEGADASQASLYLVGVGSRYADHDNADEALSDVPEDAARVAMMHHPESFEKFDAATAPLAVAGHNHGGQIRLPGFPSFSYLSFGRADSVHTDGWAHDYGKPENRLYVNRGIGMSLVPLRINCPPELTLFTLTSSAN